MERPSSGGELVFFDVETTVPARGGGGQRFWVLEFGAIRVCRSTLREVESYSTLVRPGDLSSVEERRCSGITREAVAAAPSFDEVASRIFEMLHGRIWVGHNILRFDIPRIREAFADIGRPAPEPMGAIDTLPLIAQEFGLRAGNLKLATLASFFELGRQKHRSLEDARMNLNVVKHCAAVLLLESSLPQLLLHGNQTMVTRSRANNGITRLPTAAAAAPAVARRRSSSPAMATPAVSSRRRAVPYTRGNLSQVMEGARAALRSAQATKPLAALFKHSRSFLR